MHVKDCVCLCVCVCARCLPRLGHDVGRNRKELQTEEKKSAANCHRGLRSCLPAPCPEIQRSTAGYENAKAPNNTYSHSPLSPPRAVMRGFKVTRVLPAAVTLERRQMRAGPLRGRWSAFSSRQSAVNRVRKLCSKIIRNMCLHVAS